MRHVVATLYDRIPWTKMHVQYIVDFINFGVIHNDNLAEKNMIYDIQGDGHNSTTKNH